MPTVAGNAREFKNGTPMLNPNNKKCHPPPQFLSRAHFAHSKSGIIPNENARGGGGGAGTGSSDKSIEIIQYANMIKDSSSSDASPCSSPYNFRLTSAVRRSWTIENLKKLTNRTSPSNKNSAKASNGKMIVPDNSPTPTVSRRSILKRGSSTDEVEQTVKTMASEGKQLRRRLLIKKLSQAAFEELRARMIKFSEFVEIGEAEQYDRRGDKPWARLTSEQKEQIRSELNAFKAEMDVHEEARRMTRYHRQ
ncbi:hypothetical protein niasHS_000456 [Heterodera schachtii]|uniref:Uncharacterized protein n=1 Tax=Heterodera schachtii TaxID=97005 RepID=A0ABD2K6Z6_HETSC